MTLLPYIAALSIGFLGGGHCIGMCGGIMGALTFAVPAEARGRRWRILLSYNAGRLFSYAVIGLLAGLLGYQFAVGQGVNVLRVIAGLLLVAMGLYLADWWRGLTYLEKAGGFLWRRLQPLGNRLMPVDNNGKALLLGAVWGWLPCGLVYTALAYALAQGGPWQAAGIMLAFGVGTLPAVLASGVFAERLKSFMRVRATRAVMGLLIIVFGVWTLWASLPHAGHGEHGAHGHPLPASQESVPDADRESDSNHHHHH